MALSHHIDRLRAKPEHVRERIALGASAGITGLVAMIWVVTLAATGTFSLAPSSAVVASNDVTNAEVATSPTNFSQLVGAAGAALGATSSAPALRIVDDGSRSSLETKQAAAENNSNVTVISF